MYNNLNSFFEYLLSKEIRKDLGITRDFPRYKYTIHKYYKQWTYEDIKSEEYKNFLKDINYKGQIYTTPFDWMDKLHYDLEYDVNKLKKVVQDIIILENEMDMDILKKYPIDDDYLPNFQLHNLQLDDKIDICKIIFPAKFIKSILDEESINTEYAKSTRINITKEPIICIDCFALSNQYPHYYVADGNHQSYAKIYLEKADNIEVYALSRNVWIKCLLTDRDKLFVKIYSNIQNMLSYMLGKISLNEALVNMYKI